MTNKEIELQYITKKYKQHSSVVCALSKITMTVCTGEIIAIIGKSGSGKSSLMNILGLFDHPDEGCYRLIGMETHSLSEKEKARIRNQYIGFVFQSFYLLPKLTILENVGLPLYYSGCAENKIAQRAKDVLEMIGIPELATKKPSQLSGGQQQRAAIARAIANSPSIILADEPTGALDQENSQLILNLFQELNRHNNTTIIIVTHSDLVASQCKRCIKIDQGLITEDKTNHK
ncbi:ABC transporter ATP-binding protein [Fluoribacter gormanii]|uniref:ABC transporter ATP-binding protein n=1 Tax=Fluoribacter gormanii TaxID=464 RepID=UPI001041A017|nr:ABC transporter ATP-binding protein [Fluoribacter gormanii]